MSSTTDRPSAGDRPRGQLGQALPIFAFGLIGILAVAALVFDVGQNLFERRKQQDAADAAALAGARWMTEAACKSNPNKVSCPNAVEAAEKIATRHGYDINQVQVNIPPSATSQFAGFPGHIQVTITSTRDSYFAGVLGIATSRISAMGVAANIDGYALPYSFLALGEDCTKDGWLTGNGDLIVEGDVMVSGECPDNSGPLSFDGAAGTVQIDGACATTGQIDWGPGTPVCGSVAENIDPVSDPLSGLMPPRIGGSTVPDPPSAPDVESGSVTTSGPNSYLGCPGQSKAGTAAVPQSCKIQANSNGTNEVRLYPGVYYGGIELSEGGGAKHLRVYMEPGIYYMAGGGFLVSGNIDLLTVDPGGTTFGGETTSGVLVFNSHNPDDFAACESPTPPGGDACIDKFDIVNTAGIVSMRGYPGPVYTSLILYQDRRPISQPPVKLTGNASMTIQGTFYLPEAAFEFAGGSASYVLNAQVICETFKVSGGGSLTVTYDPDDALQLSGIGLVQ